VKLWKVLSALCNEDDLFKNALKIILIGQTDYSVFESLIEFNLFNQAEKIDYLPHELAMAAAANAAVLLLPLNNTPNVQGIIPGKLFEYLALQRPILCIGPPEGDSAKIILESKAGMVAGFNDEEGMKSAIKKLYDDFNSGASGNSVPSAEINQHSRKKLSGDIASLLSEISTE
jgi:glycosyltransferase involved in cell wall biosynthesis